MSKLNSNVKIINQIRQLKFTNQYPVKGAVTKPIAVPTLYTQPTGFIATRRLSFFFRKGKKSGRESIFRDFVKKRANFFIQKKVQYKTSFFFKSFFHIATPFIGLKTRRRRKRIIHKVVLLERDRGVRKALGALSSIFQSQGNTSKPFADRLKVELESIADTYIKVRTKTKTKTKTYRNKLFGRTSKQSFVGSNLQMQNPVSSIREKRDETHRLALQAVPYRWIKKSRGKRKLVKSRYLKVKRKHRFRVKSKDFLFKKLDIILKFLSSSVG